jgi:predicted GNAT superfamily acetyltransferase
MAQSGTGPLSTADAAAARLYLAGLRDVIYFSAPRTIKGVRRYVVHVKGRNTHGRKVLDTVHSAGFRVTAIYFESNGEYYRVTFTEHV